MILSLEVEFFRKSRAQIVSKWTKFCNLTTATNRTKSSSCQKSRKILNQHTTELLVKLSKSLNFKRNNRHSMLVSKRNRKNL
jgi:hypothetical protein